MKARDLKVGDEVDGWTVVYCGLVKEAWGFDAHVLLTLEREAGHASCPCVNCGVAEVTTDGRGDSRCLGCGAYRIAGEPETTTRTAWLRADEEAKL